MDRDAGSTGSAEPVAIVGMAAVFPAAPDLDRYWRNIAEGVDAISAVPPQRVDPVFFEADAVRADRFYCRRGGFVDPHLAFDPAELGIMPLAAAEAEPDQLVALAAATRALHDAGVEPGSHDPERTGVILGRGGYITPAIGRLEQRVRTAQQLVECLRELLPDLGPDQLDAIRERFQAAFGPAHPEASIGLVPNLAASRVANRLDLRGPAYAVDAACASSLIAVSHAVTELTSGRCDLVLAGGVHHCHDVTLWSVFSQLRALSPSGQIRPFDRRADGILIGEGSGIVALKRLADAERDDDRVYAVIRGVGVASDGRAATLMNPTAEGQVLAVEQAWRHAGLDPASVGLVEAHGTGTPAGDAAEIATLREVFAGPEYPVGLGSVKSMIGHAMPASGIAGLIKAALALHHQVLPPTLHCQEPHPDLTGTRFELSTEARPWERNGTPRRAGVNAFGFGGINAHVVLEEHPSSSRHPAAPAMPVSPVAIPAAPPARVFVCSADRPDDILDCLADDQTVLAGTPLEQIAPGGGPVRLALVDPTTKRLDLARKIVARGLPWRGRNDIWFSPAGLVSQGGKVAFAFPGVEPTFAPDVDDVAHHFGIDEPEAPVATEIGRHGMGIIRVGRLMVEGLRRLGIEPDVIAGHSLGEWTAMIVSESVPPEAVDTFVGGLVAGELVLPDLVFLAVGCSAAVARAAIDSLGDIADIAVSHDNCPHQAIICGSETSVGVVQERLKAQRVMGQVLPFRTGFHTPMFGAYLEPFERCLGGLPLRAARIPLWSSITAQPFPTGPAQIKDVATRLYVEPVRFRELVDNLYADGVRLFVQPGVGSVVGFVGDTLRDQEHLAIAAAVPDRSGLAQLTRVAAALHVEGADIRFDQLVEPRPRSRADVPAVCRSPTAGRSGYELRFDSSLVRGSQEPLALAARQYPPLPAARASASFRPRSDNPLAVALTETFEAVESALRDVMQAFEAPPSAAPRVSFAPPGELVWARTISVEDTPALVDHAFYRQPEGAGVGDRFPVVPMTMMVALMIEAAQRVAGAGQLVVGLLHARALRWLSVVPPAEVVITATLTGPDRVKVAIEGYARATVLLGERYPDPPPPDDRPLEDEGPAPQTADQLYEDRWMFHGPAYRGVSEIRTMGRDGVRGAVTALPAPGALLDAAGQFVGYWLMVNADVDRIALPMRIDRIDFYGPPPPVGTRFDVTVRFSEVQPADIRADIDLVREGVVWGRMHSFTDRRFDTSPALYRVLLFPEANGLAESEPGDEGTWRVGEHWHSSAARELVMRRYLAQTERDEYAALEPVAQRDWLHRRVAVKDAVRSWLWARGAGPLYPIEIEVQADGPDGITVRGPDGVGPAVTLALEDQAVLVHVDPI